MNCLKVSFSLAKFAAKTFMKIAATAAVASIALVTLGVVTQLRLVLLVVHCTR
jgi:hypothetical protein